MDALSILDESNKTDKSFNDKNGQESITSINDNSHELRDTKSLKENKLTYEFDDNEYHKHDILNNNKNNLSKNILSRGTQQMIQFNLMVHNVNSKEYQTKIVNDIIYNENKRIVSIFKDHLIFNDPAEFLRYYYEYDESADIITKWGQFFEENDLIPLTPNYAIFDWKKLFLKNIQKKFKLREKLIANLNEENEKQNNGESNCNTDDNEDEFKNIEINDLSSSQNEKTFTRILDSKLLETQISHNKTILIGNHNDIKLCNNNNEMLNLEVINSSNNNDCTLILDSNSIINNTFHNLSERNCNYVTIDNSSCLLSKNIERNITPIPNFKDKSDFFYPNNNTIYFNDISNNGIYCSDKNVLENKFINESSKSFSLDKCNSNRNCNFNNDLLSDKFIFTSVNHDDFIKQEECINNKKLENNQIKYLSKDHINKNIKDIDYKDLFGDDNNIVESIILNENDQTNENMCVSKFEELDSFNEINKNYENANLLNLDRFDEMKSLGDINLLTTNENIFKLKSGNESNKLLKSENLNNSIKKVTKENSKLNFAINDVKEKLNMKNINSHAIGDKMTDSDDKVKIKIGFNKKMDHTKKFKFDNNDFHNKEKKTNCKNKAFNNLILKRKTKKNSAKDENSSITLRRKEYKSLSIGKKLRDISNKSNKIHSANKHDKIKFILDQKIKVKNYKTVDFRDNVEKNQMYIKEKNSSEKRHKKSKSYPHIKNLYSPMKNDNIDNDKIRTSKINDNSSKIFKYTPSGVSKNYNKSIDSGIILLNEFTQKRDKKMINNVPSYIENIKINIKKDLISYVDFNKEVDRKTKPDFIKPNKINSVEKRNYETINEMLNNNNLNKNMLLTNKPIMKNPNCIIENTIENKDEIGVEENKIRKLEKNDEEENSNNNDNNNFSVFMNKINDIFNNKIENKNQINSTKSKVELHNVKDSIKESVPLIKFISDKSNLKDKQIQLRSKDSNEGHFHSINSSEKKNIDSKFNFNDLEQGEYKSLETEYKIERGKLNEFSHTSSKKNENKFIQSVDLSKKNKLSNKKIISQLSSKNKLIINKKINKNIKENLNQENYLNYPFSNRSIKNSTLKMNKEETNNMVRNPNNFQSNSENLPIRYSGSKKIQDSKSYSYRDYDKSNLNPKYNDQIKSYHHENINSIKHKFTNENDKNFETNKQAEIINLDSKHILSDLFINLDLSQEYLEKYASENNIQKPNKKKLLHNHEDSDINYISKNIYNNSLNKFIEKNYYLNSIKQNTKNSQINNSISNLNKKNLIEFLKDKSKEEEQKILNTNKIHLEVKDRLSNIISNSKNNDKGIVKTIDSENWLPVNLNTKNLDNPKSYQKNTLNFEAFNNSNSTIIKDNQMKKFNVNEKNTKMNLNCFSNRNQEKANAKLFTKLINSDNKNNIENINKNNDHINYSTRNVPNAYNNGNKYIKIFGNNLKEKTKSLNNNLIKNNNSNKPVRKNKVIPKIENFPKKKSANKNKIDDKNGIYVFKNNLKYTNIIKKYRSIESANSSHRILENDKLYSNNLLINKTNLSKSKENILYNSQSIEVDQTEFQNINKKDILLDNDQSCDNLNNCRQQISLISNTKRNQFLFKDQNFNNQEDSASISNYKRGDQLAFNYSEKEISKEKITDISDFSKSLINQQKLINSGIETSYVKENRHNSNHDKNNNKLLINEDNYTFRQDANCDRDVNETIMNYILEKSDENYRENNNSKIFNFKENYHNKQLPIKDNLTPIHFVDDFINDNVSGLNINFENHLDLKEINKRNNKYEKLHITKLNENGYTMKNNNYNINSINKLESNRSQQSVKKYKNSLKDKSNNINNFDSFRNLRSNKDIQGKAFKQSDINFKNKDTKNFVIKSTNSPMKNYMINKLFVASNKNQEIINLADFRQHLIKRENANLEKTFENVDHTFRANKDRTLEDLIELNKTHQPYSPNDLYNNNKNFYPSFDKNKELKNDYNSRNSSLKINNKNGNYKSSIENKYKKFDVLSLLNNTATSKNKIKNPFIGKIDNFQLNKTHKDKTGPIGTAKSQNKAIENVYKKNIDESKTQTNKHFENYNVLYTDTEIIDERYILNNRNKIILENENNNNFFVGRRDNNLSKEIYSPFSNKNSSHTNLFNSNFIRNKLDDTTKSISNVFDNNTIDNIINHNYKNNDLSNNFDREIIVSNRDTRGLNNNDKLMGVINNLTTENSSSKNKLPTSRDNYKTSILKKIPNLNFNYIQNQGMNKNNPYSQSHKNLPNNNINYLNNGISSEIIKKYTNIKPLYKNISKIKKYDNHLYSNRSNINNSVKNNKDIQNRLHGIKIDKKKSNTKNIESSRISKINKKFPNLDFKQFFDNSSLVYDSYSAKNFTNTKKFLGNNHLSNRPLTNKNIQINNNIIINGGNSVPLTMNFNYDYNGNIYIENKNQNNIYGIREANNANLNNNNNNNKFYISDQTGKSNYEDTFNPYSYMNNQNKNNSSRTNLFDNNSAKNNQLNIVHKKQINNLNKNKQN